MWWLAAGTFLTGIALGVAAIGLFRRRTAQAPSADERVSQLSELAGGLAHELRNPLSTLMVNLQLLREELGDIPDPEPESNAAHARRRAMQKCEAVRGEAQRLKKLLDDFLRLAGPCLLDPADIDLHDVLDHIIELFEPEAKAAGVTVRTGFHDHPLVCRIDESLIEQALFNILINAKQAMPDGGEIIIRTRPHDARMAAIEIADTGPGLTGEQHNLVLRPFYTTKKGGTGLGLSTTHRIISEHGGKLEAGGAPNTGAQFTILLPLAARS